MDHESLTQSYGAAATTGGRWHFAGQVALQLVSIATTSALARALEPSVYGTVVGTIVVLGVFEIFSQLGFGALIVQKQEINQLDLSTAFWTLIAAGIFLATGIVTLAGPLAALMGQPGVAPLVRALGPAMILGLAAVVPRSLLERSLRFRAVATITLLGTLIYSITAVGLAVFTNAGAWSVIAGRWLQMLLLLTLFAVAAKWRPRFTFDRSTARVDALFNATFMGVSIGDYAAKNADYWVVGRTFGTQALGRYYIAYVIPSILRQRITRTAQNVLFPILSRVWADDRERAANAYLRTQEFVTGLSVPALFGIAALADPILRVFFGTPWTPASEVMSILAVAAAFTSLAVLPSTVFIAGGTPHKMWRVLGIRLAVLTAGLVIAVLFSSLNAVALAVLSAEVAAVIYSQWLASRTLGLKVKTLLTSHLPSFVTATIMAAILSVIHQRLQGDVPPLVMLAAIPPIGAIVYFSVGLLLFRAAFSRLLKELKQLLSRGHPRSKDTLARHSDS